MQDGITMSPRQGAASGGLAMLDVIVLIAMAITAAAFAAGLTLQAGLPLLPVLIATAALFLVMASSFVGRRSRGGGGDRINELEEALEIIDTDLQRIDRVEDDVARLDHLADRVEQLDQALSGSAPSGLPGGQARAEGFAAEFENVYARIEGLRAEVEAENRSQRDKIADDLGVLEGLIKRLSGELAIGDVGTTFEPAPVKAFGSRERPPAPPIVAAEEEIVVEIEEPAPEPELELEPILETEPVAELEVEEFEPAEKEKEEEEIERAVKMEEDAEAVFDVEDVDQETIEDAPAAPAAFVDDEEAAEDRMRDIIREGIEDGRVDLYLQPTVTLPDRKVRYFEALTRIRRADDDLVLPGEYMPVAKRAGLMPLIDNVLLVRSVQVLRRLGPDTRVQGVFCNVSMHSLLDPDYFPELVEFMEENTGLSENLVFEISQPEMLGLTESELGCLDTLGALGYNFCLDNVSEIEADFAGLSDRYFRYVKVSAASFLGGPGRKAAELKRELDGLGIQLIIEKVEREGDVADLLDHGIELAQGHLFGAPRPMNTALSIELEDAGAA
jgi:cyclic-di-GMP phosphodiesterase TipF (flagellum assembly factor)